MFKKLSVILAFGAFLFSGVAHANEKEVVTQMMNEAIAHYNEVGQEQAFKDFAVKGGKFNKGEYYIFVTEMQNFNLIFHGANEKLVGKNLGGLKDTDGKLFVMEMREIASGPGEGWVSYKWPNPETKKIAQKHTLVKRIGDVYFAIGYSE
ncbi:cache domain-containing protein [Sneathiella glossodoripedis]|uniref:cache domain-containing protein n=1 Tax=Sneathiella glossodoripedis TaxID=418853 RepID=UPI0004703646|nr:cache domain-containing protein [Sneathiella glossodoripedis]